MNESACYPAAVMAAFDIADTEIRRFYNAIKDGPGECREWGQGRHKQGYGLYTYRPASNPRKRRTVRAHRLAWALANGRLPAGDVCHTCDNEPCCHPAHLYDGTALTNKADQIRRGRHVHGERCHSAKLTEADVRTIRALWQQPGRPTQRTIAAQYRVSKSNINFIIRRVTWKHLLTREQETN